LAVPLEGESPEREKGKSQRRYVVGFMRVESVKKQKGRVACGRELE